MTIFISACAVDNCQTCMNDLSTCEVCDVGYTIDDSASSGKYRIKSIVSDTCSTSRTKRTFLVMSKILAKIGLPKN